jgi:glycosyltransferase involved in cell wall biosynthesis
LQDESKISKREELNYMHSEKILSILIPAINEETGIRQTISAIPKKRIDDEGYDLDIIVIDGNSSDLTREVARTMGARVVIEKRKGYGRAYKTGFCEAKGDIIITLDADGTYPAELIPEYVEELTQKGLDFITINRFSKMEDKAMAPSHRIGNSILSFTMRLLYSIKVKDSQSGMWVMSRRFIDRIKLESDDFSLSEEIKIIAFTFFKALELEGKYYKRTGKIKLDTFKDGWHNLKYLFRYRTLLRNATRSRSVWIEKEIVKKPYEIANLI